MCRVPRLSCFTIPRFDGSDVDRFGNALIKSVLLRPCRMRRMRHAGEVDLVEPYFDLVNSMGGLRRTLARVVRSAALPSRAVPSFGS